MNPKGVGISKNLSKKKLLAQFTYQSETIPPQEARKQNRGSNENSGEINGSACEDGHLHVNAGQNWKLYTCPSQTSNWLENYQAMKQFHDSFGHFLVPSDWEGQPGLAEWAAHERQINREIRQGYRDPTSKEIDRRNMLQQISFPMELDWKSRSRWQRRQAWGEDTLLV